jgi:CHAT domain-containing protein
MAVMKIVNKLHTDEMKYTIAIITAFLLLQPLLSQELKHSVSQEIQMANEYFEILQYDSATVIYQMAIETIDPRTNPEAYCCLSNRLCESLIWLDEMQRARTLCRSNLTLCNELLGTAHEQTARAQMNMGIYKFLSGNEGFVISHFKQALNIFQKIFGNVHPDVAKVYEWLGMIHESQSDTTIARTCLWKAKDVYENTIGSNHPDIAELYRYIGLYYKRFNKPDSAILYFQKAKVLFDQKYGKTNFHSVKCLNNVSDVFAKQYHNWDTVSDIFNECTHLIAGFKAPNRHAVAMTIYKMAEYHSHRKEYDQSIHYLNEILQLYYPEFENCGIFDNPLNISSSPFTIPKLIFIFKSNMLINLAKADSLNAVKYLAGASESYALLDEIIEIMAGNIYHLDDRLLFSSRHAKLYYAMAANEINLFKSGAGNQYLDNAIRYLEKNKLSGQIGLMERFTQLNNVRERRLKDSVLILTNEINRLNSERITYIEKEDTDQQLINTNLALDALHAKIAAGSIFTSAESKMKSGKRVEEIQRLLKPDEALLYYSEITHDYKKIPYALIIIAINKSEVQVSEYTGNELFYAIEKYSGMLAAGETTELLHETGEFLFEHLLEPAKSILKQKLIIYPSAFISRVPFDVLPEKSAQHQTTMMIENYIIWKIFSLDDLTETNTVATEAINDSLLAVAPAFNEEKAAEIAILTHRDINLINLPGAAKECALIAEHAKTFLLDGFAATKETFVTMCSHYGYLHISTHGTPVNGEMEIVQLAFSPASENNSSWLNFYDILNLDINAGLVVLSACKTGVGIKNNGEGNLNLAWAFRQAGARSAIISLWDVNDYACSEIMPAFYQYLKIGYSKPEALRLAKLQFIKNNDQLAASPFYWAAIDFIGEPGNSGPTEKFNVFGSWKLWLPALFLIGLSLIVCSSQKNEFRNFIPGDG